MWVWLDTPSGALEGASVEEWGLRSQDTLFPAWRVGTGSWRGNSDSLGEENIGQKGPFPGDCDDRAKSICKEPSPAGGSLKTGALFYVILSGLP